MTAAPKKNRVRTCVACGEKGDKDLLVRFVATADAIVPDWRAALPGRSAYACPTPSCLTRLYGMKRLPEKFFKGTPRFAVPAGEIAGWVRAQAESSLCHFLGLARKSGVASHGQHTLAAAFERPDAAPRAVLLAVDLAPRTVRLIMDRVPAGTTVIRWGTKERLAAATGLGPVGVFAFSPSAISDRIVFYGSVISNFS